MCDTSRHSSIFTIASLLELSQVVSERRARLLGFPLRNIIPLRNAEQVILCVTLAQEPCYPARLLRIVATSLLLEVEHLFKHFRCRCIGSQNDCVADGRSVGSESV